METKTNEQMIKEINNLKREKNAIILCHNYQRPEIYEVADFIGDSLELSRKAAETKAKIIVFCGVDFMAESAKILNPEKTVLFPNLEAKCPMAAMVTAEKLLQEKEKLAKKYPDIAVVCYINTSAEVKAIADMCCTSANSAEIVNSMKQNNILFVPDKNLADYTARFTKKKLIPWNGFCYVHAGFTAKQIKEAKKLNPNALVVAHPECPAEVVDIADKVCSTSKMIDFAKESDAKEFIIVTEQGMVNRLKREVPNKTFYSMGNVCCAQMKKIDLNSVLDALKFNRYKVELPEKTRKNAEKSLKRMLEVSSNKK